MYLVSENVLINKSFEEVRTACRRILYHHSSSSGIGCISSRVTTQLLGYSGLLPFFGFCIGFSVMENWPRSLSIQGFVIYSLAILPFWRAPYGGRQLVGSASSVSTLVIAMVWCYSVSPPSSPQAMMASVFLMLGYIALLWYEEISQFEGWYRRAGSIDPGVVIAHLLFIALHITGA